MWVNVKSKIKIGNNGRIVTRSEPLSDIECYFNVNEET